MSTLNKLTWFKNTFKLMLVVYIMAISSHVLNAQSTDIGTDLQKLQTSLKIKSNTSDYTVLIPKLKMEELALLTAVKENQLVYITDLNSGLYSFNNNEWKKSSFKEAIDQINANLEVLAPSAESLILLANSSHIVQEQMLDYNQHIVRMDGLFEISSMQNNYVERSKR